MEHIRLNDIKLTDNTIIDLLNKYKQKCIFNKSFTDNILMVKYQDNKNCYNQVFEVNITKKTLTMSISYFYDQTNQVQTFIKNILNDLYNSNDYYYFGVFEKHQIEFYK